MFPKCWHWLNWFDPFPLILTSWKIWPIKPRKCDKRAQILQMSMNDHLPQWQKWHEVCAMEGLGGGGQAYHDNGRILRDLGCSPRCDAITLWWEAASIAWNTLPNSRRKNLGKGQTPPPFANAIILGTFGLATHPWVKLRRYQMTLMWLWPLVMEVVVDG